MTDSRYLSWPISVGTTLKRVQVHAMVGGAHQWGVTSCLGGAAMLIFADPVKSREFGYDKWEGMQLDGSFHYTGQGKFGPQTVDSGPNRRLLKSNEEGRLIHVFRAQSPYVTYIGIFHLGEPPYRWESAPDTNGIERPVVVFHLIPNTSGG